MLTIFSEFCWTVLAPFMIHCKFWSAITMPGWRIVVLCDGLIVILAPLVAKGTVCTIAGIDSVLQEDGSPLLDKGGSPCVGCSGAGEGWTNSCWWVENCLTGGTGTEGVNKMPVGFLNAVWCVLVANVSDGVEMGSAACWESLSIVGCDKVGTSLFSFPVKPKHKIQIIVK